MYSVIDNTSGNIILNEDSSSTNLLGKRHPALANYQVCHHNYSS